MSTYGTALVLDVPADAHIGVLEEALQAQDGFISWHNGAGFQRLAAYMPMKIDQYPLVERLLAWVARGRAAIAEDYDEFGALWMVLEARNGTVRTVHRRYVLNANPRRPWEVKAALASLDGVDPRKDDVPGAAAAAEAAAVFDADERAMVTAERASKRAYRELGVIGGPFPWWTALGLPWPGDEPPATT